MKLINSFSFLSAGVFLLLGCFAIVPSANAQSCANNTGTCAPSTICTSDTDRRDIGPDDACPSDEICCLLPEGQSAPTVSAPLGTKVTEDAGKGNTTVGYGLKNPLGSRTIPQIIGAIIGWLSGLAGALFMLYLIWGGIEWMTAGGSSEKLKKGQQKIIYAILGVVIVVLSYFIVDMVIGLTNIPPGT